MAASPPEFAGPPPGSPTLSANSSRNNRRSDLSEREYLANSAPLTVSGRLVSAKICPSSELKYGARRSRSSAVNSSGSTCGLYRMLLTHVLGVSVHLGTLAPWHLGTLAPWHLGTL